MGEYRFFVELSYLGTAYSGFQKQINAHTIQGEVEKALYVLTGQAFILSGSSRTDAGVHALQNFFHFDATYEQLYNKARVGDIPSLTYKLNAILPADICIKKIHVKDTTMHCRFDATSRLYQYHIYWKKNPFLKDIAYFYPYTLDYDILKQCAGAIRTYTDFTSFSKKKTQVHTFNCAIYRSEWQFTESEIIYTVEANRFLRGMVRALTATMLLASRNGDFNSFINVIEARDCSKASFSAPPQGLFLCKVNFAGNAIDAEDALTPAH